MLRTKCILVPREAEDGLRISVMSRHTLSDGVTPDERITDDLFDVHMPTLAPSLTLIREYYKWRFSRDAFMAQYCNEIYAKEAQLRALAKRALAQDITLLCIEEGTTFCHRRILAEALQKVEPALEVSIA